MHYIPWATLPAWNRKTLLIVLGIAIFAPTLMLSAQTASTDILFMSDRDGNREIYVMNADGNNVRRLTDHPAEDTEPTWSPNGQQIAFASNRDGEFAVYIMNKDGSNPRRLSPDVGSYAASPSWSPDGTRIAYVSNALGTSQIHIIGLDGSEDRALTQRSYESIDPTWSPDGETLLFASNPNGNFELFIVRRDGTGMRQITNDSTMDSDSPAWSPSGDLVVFAANSARLGELYVMNSTGSDVRVLVSTENAIISSPTWSPDGQSIVYSLYISDLHSLQRVYKDGFGLESLDTRSGNSSFPSWATPVQYELSHPFAGTAVPLNRPLPISVTRPRSLQQGLNYESIWSMLEFQDIDSPGVATYDLLVNATQTFRWVFTWCASNTLSLAAVLEPLASIEFRVDGTTIDSVLEYSAPDCRGWITLLSDWPTDQTISLEVVYVLSDELFDGNKRYSPGQYVQQIIVTAR